MLERTECAAATFALQVGVNREYNIDNPAIHWEPPDQGWVVFVVVAE